MLQSLHIHNFALIEDLHLTFGEGVTIFTGETGAGKSILLDAIGMLAGKRASAAFVRQGTDSFLQHFRHRCRSCCRKITLNVKNHNWSFHGNFTAAAAVRRWSMGQ